MNVLVVDTSSWISYFAFKVDPKKKLILDEALKEGRVYLSPVVAAELFSGSSLSKSQRDALKKFLMELPLCETPLEHWIEVGELRSELSQKGLSVSTADAHVAQCALSLNGYLLSEDEIFKKIVATNTTPLKLFSTV